MSTPIRAPNTPALGERLLLAFAAVAVIADITSYWNGEIFWAGFDPYADYHRNAGIHAIEVAAFVLGLCIALILIPVLWRRRLPRPAAWALCALCLVGAVLPYVELWWGSTFYYGEVRDKQGLPFGVTFGGPFGVSVFLSYILARSGLSLGVGSRRRLILFATWGVMIWLQLQALHLLEDRWNLGQN